MRRVPLAAVLLLFSVCSHASPFSGYITSYEKLTPQGAYVSVIGTLPNLGLKGGASGFLLPTPIGACFTSPNLADPDYLNCTSEDIGGACAGPIEVYIQWSIGSIDNYDSPNGDGCTYSAIRLMRGRSGITGSILGMDVFSTSTGWIYEGINLHFKAPPLPHFTTLWDYQVEDEGLWYGSGNFWVQDRSPDYSSVTGELQGTFNIGRGHGVPEPGTFMLLGIGLGAIGFRRLRRS